MADKKSFILYTEYREQIEMLNNEQAGQLMKAIFSYEAGYDPEITDPMAGLLFSVMKRFLDENREKYNNKCEANHENGKKGGRPPKNKSKQLKSEEGQTEENPNKPNGFSENQMVNIKNPKNLDNESESDNDSEKDKKESAKEKAHTRFTPPTVEDVSAYAAEKKLYVDANRFIDYYESKGWMVGKSKMKDWKAAVRNWSRNEFNKASPMPAKPKEEKTHEEIIRDAQGKWGAIGDWY